MLFGELAIAELICSNCIPPGYGWTQTRPYGVKGVQMTGIQFESGTDFFTLKPKAVAKLQCTIHNSAELKTQI